MSGIWMDVSWRDRGEGLMHLPCRSQLVLACAVLGQAWRPQSTAMQGLCLEWHICQLQIHTSDQNGECFFFSFQGSYLQTSSKTV